MLEIAFAAIKANTVKLQSVMPRNKPATVLFQTAQPSQNKGQIRSSFDPLFGVPPQPRAAASFSFGSSAMQEKSATVERKTEFETSFKLNKSAVLMIKQMKFKKFVFSQGARTETIEEEISAQHLFYIEPELNVTISLTVEPPQAPLGDIGPNTIVKNGLKLDVFSMQYPNDGRSPALEFSPVEEEIEDFLMKEFQAFIDSFEKTKELGAKGALW